ncbi:hypothetical protein UNDYM_4288 [Undibacterium sp. YM2]|uniref:hypothetical protein n=1 Tax=Undibacterium sp. YM2 TaxID=2058625 RepID=UPI001331F592|nr:hypothetical protein [Undibacterium sp. YM2]BBB68541.1 hypothetical protein UNDYM_4288 [Undibacterium sp. YM2]
MNTFLSWLANDPQAYLTLGIILLLAGILSILLRVLKSDSKSFADYLLLWPIVIAQHKKTATKNSNKFLAWGLLVMVLLVVGNMVFLR